MSSRRASKFLLTTFGGSGAGSATGMALGSWGLSAEALSIIGKVGYWTSFAGDPKKEGHCASMCVATDFWRGKLLQIVTRLASYGVDGVYIDQVAAAWVAPVSFLPICHQRTTSRPWMPPVKRLEA